MGVDAILKVGIMVIKTSRLTVERKNYGYRLTIVSLLNIPVLM